MRGSYISLGFMGTVISGLLMNAAHSFELSTWGDAFRNGTPVADVRYRFEQVSQDNALEDAGASTLRTRLGFKTDFSLKLAAVVEVENVTVIGSEQYNSATNGLDNYSVVLDPETTEVNQAFLRLSLNSTNITVGRRRMVFDNGRFLGNVGFRQNEQTYDAAVIMDRTFPGHTFMYAYMDKAHRFFGDDSPAGNLDMSSHFANYNYQWLNQNNVSLYAYFLEMDLAELAARSTKTFGIRLKGGVPIGTSRLFYALEYADQSPYADGNDANNANYVLAELGYRFSNQWSVALGNEIMGGDGTYAFQTPLATAHAFAGDADLFAAATPANGLNDRYVKLVAPTKGFNIRLSYHDFISDSADLNYGTEWDAVVSRKFGEHFELGLQYASYQADQFAVDTDKAWVWFGYKH